MHPRTLINIATFIALCGFAFFVFGRPERQLTAAERDQRMTDQLKTMKGMTVEDADLETQGTKLGFVVRSIEHIPGTTLSQVFVIRKYDSSVFAAINPRNANVKVGDIVGISLVRFHGHFAAPTSSVYMITAPEK